MTALDAKRMQTFFNEFIVTTYTFLNKFSSVCEHKLINLERKLTKIEASIILIEQKLSDIPVIPKEDVDDVRKRMMADVEEESRTNEEQNSYNQPPPANKLDENQSPDNIPPTNITETKSETIMNNEEIPKSMIKISEVPLYRKYFMMLKVGIPIPAVQQKMRSEGVEVDLSNPDALIENTFSDEDEKEQ